MNNIELEIFELEKEVAKKKKELEDLNKPLVITYSKLGKSPNPIDILITLSKWEAKVVDILRIIPNRSYDGKNNRILLRDFNAFRAALPKDLTYSEAYDPPELEVEVIKLISAPDFMVTLSPNKDKIRITKGPLNMFGIQIYGLDSFRVEPYGKFWTVDVAELWRFVLLVKEQNQNRQVEYSEEVISILNTQSNRRNILDKLSKAEDSPDTIVPLIGGDKFYGFQKVALEFAKATNFNCILALDMGLGKTPISIALAELTNSRVLFVVPATLKTNTLREIKKWTGKDALVLSGSAPTSADVESLISNKSQYNIINYDVIGRETKGSDPKEPGVQKWVAILNASRFDMIIGDELHYIKNDSSLRSKGMRNLIAPKKIGLTGTPIVNKPSELFPALNWISPENFPGKDRFLNSFMDLKGYAKNVPRLKEMLQDYMFRRKKEEVIKDLPPIIRIDHFTTLSDNAKEHYNKALEGLYIALRNPNYQKEINSILAQLTRLKQIVSDDKINATIELANEAYEETGKKVLVYSQFVDTCRAIAGGLDNSLCITGEATDEERYERIDRFQSDDSIRYMVLSTKAGAEGITLTAAHTVIFNDLCWTPKDHRQAEARCYGRMSDMHGAIAYYVQVSDTIDEMIAAILMKKMNIIEAIVDELHTDQGHSESIISELLSNLRKRLS